LERVNNEVLMKMMTIKNGKRSRAYRVMTMMTITKEKR